MVAPTRYPSGVSTSSVIQPLSNYPNPTPFKVFTDYTDFTQYVAGDWTVTNTTSHATIGLTAGQGGWLSIAGGGSSVTADIGAIQNTPADFNFTSGQQVWFATKVKATTALNDQLLVGLASSIAALTPTDGIYFNKAAGSTSIDFVVRKSSTSTTQSAVATLANDTFITLAFYYNGKDEIAVFANDVKVYSQTTLTNLPTSVALAQGFGVKAAATAPTTSNIVADYILSSQERS